MVHVWLDFKGNVDELVCYPHPADDFAVQTYLEVQLYYQYIYPTTEVL